MRLVLGWRPILAKDDAVLTSAVAVRCFKETQVLKLGGAGINHGQESTFEGMRPSASLRGTPWPRGQDDLQHVLW